jgi:hypothetical protein
MKQFGKDNLDGFFRECATVLISPIEVYLLGGGAMCFRNQKNATKDLDLVFQNAKVASQFEEALKKLSFIQKLSFSREYQRMKTASIWERPGDDLRIDLFIEQVCGALTLTEKMRTRSTTLNTFGNLTIKIVSNEDVILFKSITERPNDTNDIAAIIRASSIDWNIIRDECIEQSNENLWYINLNNKLLELSERHGIYAPIIKEVESLSNKALIIYAAELRRNKGLSREQIIKEIEDKLGDKLTRNELDLLDEKNGGSS